QRGHDDADDPDHHHHHRELLEQDAHGHQPEHGEHEQGGHGVPERHRHRAARLVGVEGEHEVLLGAAELVVDLLRVGLPVERGAAVVEAAAACHGAFAPPAAAPLPASVLVGVDGPVVRGGAGVVGGDVVGDEAVVDVPPAALVVAARPPDNADAAGAVVDRGDPGAGGGGDTGASGEAGQGGGLGA